MTEQLCAFLDSVKIPDLGPRPSPDGSDRVQCGVYLGPVDSRAERKLTKRKCTALQLP
jgi:hypothetical protein